MRVFSQNMADTEWKVLPHGPIVELEENVWSVTR